MLIQKLSKTLGITNLIRQLKMKTLKKIFLLTLIFINGNPIIAEDRGADEEIKIINIDFVPSDFPVNFSLATKNNNQFVAYYDSTHQLTIASRKLNSLIWDYQKLDSKVGWDSHNSTSIAIDKLGYIHISGNMHSSQLIYFKSCKPYDIHSIIKLNKMIGEEESITTYPEFITNTKGDLIFHYRFGRSGDGYEVYNILDVGKQTWKRLLDKPLTDGEKERNAYMQRPLLGKDGYYHMIWVWRETPDCSTNHTLSYARSKDLLHWEGISGKKVRLPITLRDSALIVDPTPIKGGLINIGIKIGFDSKNNVLIGYHKYDKNGNTQLYISRFENNKWLSKQLTQWNYRWDFKGMGTIENELLIESPQPSVIPGELVFGYHHNSKYGNGQVVIDENTLKFIRNEPYNPPYPSSIDSVESVFPGMQVNIIQNNSEKQKEYKYILRWESLPPNRDIKRTENIPPPSILQLYQIKNK
jgi:hypothetical protein